MPDGRVMLGFVAALVFAFVPSIRQSAEIQATKPGVSAPAASRKQIERGHYLVVVGSCNDFHTSHRGGPKGICHLVGQYLRFSLEGIALRT